MSAHGELVLRVVREGLLLVLVLSGPPLLASLLVGLLLGVFQGATQIQDPTLAFVPKLVVLGVALTVAGPFMFSTLTDYTHLLFDRLIASGGQ